MLIERAAKKTEKEVGDLMTSDMKMVGVIKENMGNRVTLKYEIKVVTQIFGR